MNERENKIYKSPRRKLVRFFETSRDRWKRKCMEAKGTVKRLNHRIRYLESSKAQWKDRAKELEKELTRMKTQQTQGQEQKDDKKNS